MTAQNILPQASPQGKVNVFHVGPQKTGTTWLYEAMREHPDVSTSPMDSVHFFSMFHDRGIDWYHSHFADKQKRILLDPSPSYLRDPQAAARIKAYNPDARIVLTARNPVERAFSHFWHEKKKSRFSFEFAEVFENFDLFANWVEPGFYAVHLKRFLDHFPREQVCVLVFDDLKHDPGAFLDQMLAFCGMEQGFRPSVIGKKVNAAGNRTPSLLRKIKRAAKLNNLPPALTRPVYKLGWVSKPETLESQSEKLVEQLARVFLPDIEELEKLISRDLHSWKQGI